MERTPETTSKGSDPVKVFAVLAVILVVVGVVFWLTRPDSAALPGPLEAQPLPETDFSLTDAEAIARFKELESLKLRVYRTGDLSLLRSIFTNDSPSTEIVEADLRKLDEASVQFRSQYETKSLSVRSNGSDEIRIEQSVLVRPRLIGDAGENITDPARQKQRVVWVLHREVDAWLIYKTVVTSARTL